MQYYSVFYLCFLHQTDFWHQAKQGRQDHFLNRNEKRHSSAVLVIKDLQTRMYSRSAYFDPACGQIRKKGEREKYLLLVKQNSTPTIHCTGPGFYCVWYTREIFSARDMEEKKNSGRARRNGQQCSFAASPGSYCTPARSNTAGTYG